MFRPIPARASTPCPRRSRVSRTISRKSSRSEEHTSELQSQSNLVCRLLLEKKKNVLSTNRPQTNLNLSIRNRSHALEDIDSAVCRRADVVCRRTLLSFVGDSHSIVDREWD